MKNVYGVYFENGEVKAVKCEFEHEDIEETTDIESAVKALRAKENKDFVLLYAQNYNGKYVGISTKHSGNFYKGLEKYDVDMRINYTAEMAVAEIEKLIAEC